MTNKTQALFDYASNIISGELKKSSNRWYGCCPLHKEKDASFMIQGDRFRCFGCGQGGTVFDLWMLHNGFVTEPLDKEGFLAAKKALGFWDHSRPAPMKRTAPRQVFDKIFHCTDKKTGWQEAVRSLKGKFDQKINFCGREYWNFEFVAECLRHRSKEEIEDWLIKIVNWFPNVTQEDQRFREMILNNINEYLGR